MRERYTATSEHADDPIELDRPAPGRRTLTQRLSVPRREHGPVQRRVESAPVRPRAALDGGDDPFALHLTAPQRPAAPTTDDIHAAAHHGVSGPAGSLPHADIIQRAFGKHDVTAIRAHTGPAAAQATAAMGARAFAAGDDVAFGPAGLDLHTAAHEAAHVVQQRGGVQLAGGVGQVGDAHERHADAVADLVVQGRSAEALLDEYVGAATSGAATQRAVQRAVGFEFETGWFIDKRELEVPDIEDVPTGLPKPTGKVLPLKKKERIGNTSHTNFKVEADEADGGRSEIELIVHPPIPEGRDGFALLQRTMKDLAVFGQGLLSAASEAGGKPFTLDKATGASLDQFYVVGPTDTTLNAGIQYTAGLDLAQVPRLLPKRKERAKDEKSGEHEHDKDDRSCLQGPRFQGFLAMVGEYLSVGAAREDASAINYPKRLGEPLLARTSFVGLYKLVEPEVRKYFAEKPQAWLPTILEAVGLNRGWADKDLISRGIVDDALYDEYLDLLRFIPETAHELKQARTRMDKLDQQIEQLMTPPEKETKKGLAQAMEELGSLFKKKEEKPPVVSEEAKQQALLLQERKLKINEQANDLQVKLRELRERHRDMVKFTGLTIGDWLEGILAGEDKLTGVKDAESMGEFGEKTEKVGPERIDGGIFEFRGDQAKKLPLSEWPKAAEAYFLHVMRLNGHDT